MAHYLTLKGNGKMRWSEKKSKVGSRRFRHRAARLVMKHCTTLPVSVLITKVDRAASTFYFEPQLINSSRKMVFLYYKNVMAVVHFKDVSFWIQTFIESNKMYEQPMFQSRT